MAGFAPWFATGDMQIEIAVFVELCRLHIGSQTEARPTEKREGAMMVPDRMRL